MRGWRVRLPHALPVMSIESFVKLSAAEQKSRAEALGLTKPGDEKRMHAEIVLWTCRALEQGKFDELFMGL